MIFSNEINKKLYPDIEEIYNSPHDEKKVFEISNIDINIPAKYMEVLNYLKSLNVKSYIVGGAVRDFILNKTFSDYDILCLCSLDHFKSLNPSFHKIIEFDNVLILNNDDFSFSLSFSTSFEYDYISRDYSINSIYYDWVNKKILGYQKSFCDIYDYVLSPCNEEFFVSDSLKILRGVRLSKKCNLFLDISLKSIYSITLEDIKTRLDAIRLRNEFFKHDLWNLNNYGLIPSIVSKLQEFNMLLDNALFQNNKQPLL